MHHNHCTFIRGDGGGSGALRSKKKLTKKRKRITDTEHTNMLIREETIMSVGEKNEGFASSKEVKLHPKLLEPSSTNDMLGRYYIFVLC